MPFGRLSQWEQNLDPFSGLAESAGTSNVLFLGDAVSAVFSLTTSSATASRWTLQGNEDDGFTAALGAVNWQSAKAVTAQGYYSVDTLPRWGRFQRTVSASSTTLRMSIKMGP